MDDRYQKLREEYEGRGLEDISHLDPFPLFDEWQADAERAQLPLANAMALATADETGAPSVRTVLLKNVDEHSRLWFYTDYESQKGRELLANPAAELLFYWQPLHRQVRVRGTVAQLADSDSDTYFASRPRKSSLSAMASNQSRVVDTPGALEQRRAELEREFADRPLERPPRWGGFALTATRFEFWQGRPDRLHHRLVFERAFEKETSSAQGAWTRSWLAP